ncbi:MAG: hypothetical protein DRJ03_27545, partial [Chloroflexi bacterium]
LMHGEYVSVYNPNWTSIEVTIVLEDHGTERIMVKETLETENTLIYANGDWGKAFDVPTGAVDTSGTPADDQIAVFTDADTIEGTSSLTFSGSLLTISGHLAVGNGTESMLIGHGTTNGVEGTENTFLGYHAGYNNSTTAPGGDSPGDRNVYIGNRAGAGETSGSDNSGSENVAVGSRALRYCTSGYENTAIGDETMQFLTTGHGNIALGNDAMQGRGTGYPITGDSNVALGTDVFNDIDDGSYNIGIGYNAGKNIEGGDYNLLIGHEAGYLLEDNNSNLFIGYRAGYNQTSVSNTVIIDNIARASAAEEEEESLLYGVCDANPANQIIRINGRIGFGTSDPNGKIHVAGTTGADIARYDVGIDFSGIETPPAGSMGATLVAEAGNIDAGAHRYCLAMVTDLGETSLHVGPVITTTAGSGKVDLTFPVSTDSRVTQRKLYRTAAGAIYYSNMQLLHIVDNNVDTTYRDDIPDSSLTGTNYFWQPNTTNSFITYNNEPVLFVDLKNVMLGVEAPTGTLTNRLGSENVFIGGHTGEDATTVNKSVHIGRYAGRDITTGDSNVLIGHQAGANANPSVSVILGRNTGYNIGGAANVFLGHSAFYATSALSSVVRNVAIGYQSGYGASGTPARNTFIGTQTGYNNAGATYNVLLGNQAGYRNTSSNRLIIDNQDRTTEAAEATNSLIYGVFDATPANQTLSLNADVIIRGDLNFGSTGKGLAYGEISVVSNSTTTTISASGTKYQVTIFDTDGPNNNTTPAHGTDDITITQAGDYMINVSATVNSVGGTSSRFEMDVRKNNGATAVGALHCDRNMPGGGASSGVISMSGIATLAVNDTIEVWIENEDNTTDYVVEDITLTVIQIGG